MRQRAELVTPSLRDARSHVAALREGFRRGAQDHLPERRIGQIEADFARYIEGITDQTGRVRLPTGEIVPKGPFSVSWLVEGDAFIGETSIRQRSSAQRRGPRRLWHPTLTPAPALRQADSGARARAVPPARHRAGARHLLGGQRRFGADHRGERRSPGERDPDPAGRGPLRRYWISL
jgi:hypothetical protein